jgi:hypothetical protein
MMASLLHIGNFFQTLRPEYLNKYIIVAENIVFENIGNWYTSKTFLRKGTL